MKGQPSEVVAFLKRCSYTDFVGTIAQTNVPPGALSTVSQWAVYSRMGAHSHVYEVACTTGFSLRESSRQTGCSGEGVDISALSVETASREVAGTPLGARLSYVAADALVHTPVRKPSHIIVGAALGFFPEPARMVERCTQLFEQTGFLLASPFYAQRDIPPELTEEARRVLGIRPTTAGYKAVMSAFRGLQVAYENRQHIEMETQDELRHYCESTARRAMRLLDQNSDEVFNVIFSRLFEIKDLCNRLRPFQGYSVLVLRYERSEFPDRFVELF